MATRLKYQEAIFSTMFGRIVAILLLLISNTGHKNTHKIINEAIIGIYKAADEEIHTKH
jgi:hypothetical protein